MEDFNLSRIPSLEISKSETVICDNFRSKRLHDTLHGRRVELPE